MGLDMKGPDLMVNGRKDYGAIVHISWSYEEEDRARDGGFIKFKYVDGANHFVSDLHYCLLRPESHRL